MYMNVTQEAFEMFQKHSQAKKSEVGGVKLGHLLTRFIPGMFRASPIRARKRYAF